ncbi:MAG: YhgE/Pip family protein [Actinomycetaceae bacterium]|nr:YhgE/Pip family protein [Actinomycetaceae bacterium]
MKQILFIARDDLRQIGGSMMTRIFMVVLISVPLFFTWFNVLATWEPFDNMDRLQIAVASTDEGYTSEVLNLEVNVGDVVLKDLAANDQIDWVITNKDKALEGTRSGEYYAAIVLPENFSRSMFTFYAGGASPADITLYTNEKKNPLSANITTQGAQGVTSQINTTFSKTLADVTVGMAEDVSSYLDDAETQATLDRLDNRLESLTAQLNAGADTIDSMSALLGSSIPLATGAESLAKGLQGSFDNALGGSIGAGVSDPFGSVSSGLSDSLDLAAENISQVESRLDDLLDSADSTAQSSADVVEQLASMLDEQIAGFQETRDEIVRIVGPGGTGGTIEGDPQIDWGVDLEAQGPAIDQLIADLDAAISRQQSLSDRMKDIASDLRGGVSSTEDSRQSARAAVQQAIDAISTARTDFSENFKPQIDSLRSNLESAGANAAVFSSYMDSVKAQLGDGSNGLIATMRSSQESLAETANGMRDGASRLGDVRKQVEEARSSGDFDKIAKALGNDPEGLARMISSPVTVDRKPVFPVASFGVGMTPLFTMIALWVGALLAGVFLRTDVSENVRRRYAETFIDTNIENEGEPGADDEAEISEALETSGELAGLSENDAVEPSEDESAEDPEGHGQVEASEESDGAEDPEELERGEDSEGVEKSEKSEQPARSAKRAKKPVFTAAQEYLGRYVMFWLVGMAQSTFLMVGLIMGVQVEPAHPFLLILAGWVISTVFTNIVYTLVISLSNAGKAVTVLLLVLQISAAGGAYPLELLPQWFQNISPWLPATYAINLMRSAIAGIYAGDFVQDLGMILLFLIPNLIVGLVLRHAIAGRIDLMTKSMEKTKVM